jgi:hypothetical protein
MTARSPVMMDELRRVICLLDTNNMTMRARYIRLAANVWADKLRSRYLGNNEWKLDPLLFAEPDARFGKRCIDRFASARNTLPPRYNAGCRDPACEAVDALHLSDVEWRKKNNGCNLPWPLLPNLAQKLRQSGAASTTVASLNKHGRFDTKHLPRWSHRNQSSFTVRTCSNPGIGLYAVQKTVLIGP